MKYTSIQGTGVVAHRTELTVEEKYAVMNVIELAMFAGDTKPDFSKLLLRKVCGLATVLVAEPQCKDNTIVLAGAIDELKQIIDQARRSIDDGEEDKG